MTTVTSEASAGADPDGAVPGGPPPEDVAAVQEEWPGATSVAGVSVHVVGTAEPRVLAEVVSAGDAAWERCRSTWPEPLPGVVVLVPGTEAEAAAVTGTGSADQEQALVATTVVVGAPGRPGTQVRVQLHPRGWNALSAEGRRVILTHECVHVALAQRDRPDAPLWVVEGVAEHVAHTRSEIPAQQILAPLLERVRRDGPPTTLPQDRDFATDDDEAVLLAYAQAWSAASAYAGEYGEEALFDLVITGPTGGDDGDTVWADVERDLVPLWQDLLTDLSEGG